jgi:hypothetical protein
MRTRVNVGSDPDLVFSGASARPYKRIRPKIALNVGRNDLSSDAFTGHKPLICARHVDDEVCRKGEKRKMTLMSVPRTGQAMGAKWDKEGLRGGALGSKKTLQKWNRQHGWKWYDPVVSDGFRCPKWFPERSARKQQQAKRGSSNIAAPGVGRSCDKLDWDTEDKGSQLMMRQPFLWTRETSISSGIYE